MTGTPLATAPRRLQEQDWREVPSVRPRASDPIYPAVSVLLSYVLLHERPHVAPWVGIIFVIVGVILPLSGPTATITPEEVPRP
jgi:hypothetical protein